MRFRFDRGVDGFRIDVLWHVFKADGFPDNPVNPAYEPAMGEKFRVLQLHSTDQPEIHALMGEMRQMADSYDGGDERLLVGEICLPLPRLMTYYGPRQNGVHLPFNFALVETEWDARTIATLIEDYEAALPDGGWPNWVMGSHDARRIAARVGDAQARVAAMLLLTLRGTPTLYQGDEIGIGDVDIPADALRDPRELREPGLGLGRDPARTPMAWDGTTNGGFTQGEPWLPLHDDWISRNIGAQQSDPGSMLHLYRSLLHLRRRHPALSGGRYVGVEAQGDVLAYRRENDDEAFLILLNLGQFEQQMPVELGEFLPILSTLKEEPLSKPSLLQPDEGLLLIRR
jgi:glycosidase